MPKVIPRYREQAVQRILEAANEEFTRRGYQQTTMSDIAARLGVTKPTLYQYFRSKEELVAAVGNLMVQKIVGEEFSTRGQPLAKTSEGAFGRMLERTPDWFLQLVCDLVAATHSDPAVNRQVSLMEKRLVASISSRWNAAKEAGEIAKDVDTEIVAWSLVTLSLGLLAFIPAGLPRAKADEIWRGTVKTLIRGMNPKKRPSQMHPT